MGVYTCSEGVGESLEAPPDMNWRKHIYIYKKKQMVKYIGIYIYILLKKKYK